MQKIPEDFGSLSAAHAALAASDFIQYLLAAGAVWLFFYVLFRGRLGHRKVIPAFAGPGNIRREILLSAMTCALYGVVGLLSILAIQRGWTRVYFDIEDRGWGWFIASIVLTIFVHDAYFYWTHRLMHLRPLFALIHRDHHRSTNPTPWAAYAFGPLEALMQAGILPLVIFLYPIHPLAFIIFMLVQIGFNVMGHAGFEIFPRWFLDTWMGKFLNTPTNHAMHHQYFTGNYGLYFNLWDRLMGTNHKDYEKRFRDTASRPAASGDLAPKGAK